jgi:3-dehydroquinate synthase
MSDNFQIHSAKHDYHVSFEDDFTVSLERLLKPGDVIFIDSNVNDLYRDRLDKFLNRQKHMVIEPSEEKKSYLQLVPSISYLIENGFKKNNRLIAIGGGITQDITGFISSIIYRGVDWIFYPTTLLAQCDSCIGSKTSINFSKYKNQIGTFYPPIEVLIDLTFLDTLPELAMRSGLGEMMHYYLISGEKDFQRIRKEYGASFGDKLILKGLIARSLAIKKDFIEKDEFDRSERQVLNYGHSFGHAIETLSDYKIPHGIAVSFGMDIANFISSKLGYISKNLREEIWELLAMNWGETRLAEINIADFEAILRKDKKNVGEEVRVILTRGLGKMFKTRLSLDKQVLKWLEEYFHGQTRGDY